MGDVKGNGLAGNKDEIGDTQDGNRDVCFLVVVLDSAAVIHVSEILSKRKD